MNEEIREIDQATFNEFLHAILKLSVSVPRGATLELWLAMRVWARSVESVQNKDLRRHVDHYEKQIGAIVADLNARAGITEPNSA